MKLEQACRFALEETGYGISAVSEGFQEENRTNLESAFNDTLNACFASVGESIFELCRSGNDYFVALCTLRSDIGRRSARKTIFTNAAVISAKVFREMIAVTPEVFFNVSPNSFLSSQPGLRELPALELMERENDYVLDSILKRRGLGTEEYAQLLYMAYSALFERETLCIDTAESFDECITLSQDIAYCVLRGFLPGLRHQVTYSSGRDARNLVSVASETGGDWNTGIQTTLHFYIDPARRSAAEPIPGTPYDDKDMMRMICREIATQDSSARETFLSAIEEEIRDYTDSRDHFSRALLLLSFYGRFRGDCSARESGYLLFYGISDELQQIVSNNEKLNRSLTCYVQILFKSGVCPNTQIVSKLIDRALAQEDDVFLNAVGDLSSLTDSDTKLFFVGNLLNKEYSVRIKILMETLLASEDILTADWNTDLKQRLLEWVCLHDVARLGDLCSQLVRDEPCEAIRSIVRRHTDTDSPSTLGQVEQDLLISTLKASYDSSSAKGLVSTEACRYLDRQFDGMTNDLKEEWVTYSCRALLQAATGLEEKLSHILEIEIDHPGLFEAICSYIRDPQHEMRDLWEAYVSHKELFSEGSFEKLIEITRQTNEFLDPNGTYEKNLSHIWTTTLDEIVKSLWEDESISDEERSGYLHEEIRDAVTACGELNCSDDTREDLIRHSIILYWNNTSYETLMDPAAHRNINQVFTDIADVTCISETCVQNKLNIFRILDDLLNDPTDRNGILDFYEIIAIGELEKYSYSLSERKSIRDGLVSIIRFLLEDMDYLSWDLAVLGSLNLTDAKKILDMEMLSDTCRMMQDMMEFPADEEGLPEDLIMYHESHLLCGENRDEKIRKEIVRGVSKEAPELLRILSECIRRDGSASFFDILRRRRT